MDKNGNQWIETKRRTKGGRKIKTCVTIPPQEENLGGTTGIGLWISAFHAKWFRFF